MFTLETLETIIASRAVAGEGASYTASLLAKGPAGCARKMGEEALETVIAAVEGNRTDLRNEAADLLYHLLVLLKAGDIPLAEVMAELERRTGQSGHAEKASRQTAPGN